MIQCIFSYYLRSALSGEDEDLFAVVIDVELAGVNHSR